ncbi:hypothetical protein SUDANB66_06589 (plasmid) [Streptomyces sp. SudanB66_2053]
MGPVFDRSSPRGSRGGGLGFHRVHHGVDHRGALVRSTTVLVWCARPSAIRRQAPCSRSACQPHPGPMVHFQPGTVVQFGALRGLASSDTRSAAWKRCAAPQRPRLYRLRRQGDACGRRSARAPSARGGVLGAAPATGFHRPQALQVGDRGPGPVQHTHLVAAARKPTPLARPRRQQRGHTLPQPAGHRTPVHKSHNEQCRTCMPNSALLTPGASFTLCRVARGGRGPGHEPVAGADQVEVLDGVLDRADGRGALPDPHASPASCRTGRG